MNAPQVNYLASGHVPAGHRDETLEVVFCRAMPRDSICRVLSLDQTNRRFAERRRGQAEEE